MRIRMILLNLLMDDQASMIINIWEESIEVHCLIGWWENVQKPLILAQNHGFVMFPVDFPFNQCIDIGIHEKGCLEIGLMKDIQWKQTTNHQWSWEYGDIMVKNQRGTSCSMCFGWTKQQVPGGSHFKTWETMVLNHGTTDVPSGYLT